MELRSIKPLYSKSRVTRAGENIRENKATEDDYAVIENWRASHNKILNSWQAMLRNRCRQTEGVVFAQRLKRKSTIFDKLNRQKGMDLARMQDIAGCRLIFSSIESLNKFRNKLHKARIDHKRIKSAADKYPYDYIQYPKESGYRGIHDVFEYCARSSRDQDWDGLKVEIQYRTTAQHAWATAVEIAGSITGSLSKFNQGSEGQKEFFKLASEIIARAHEGMTSCFPNTSDIMLCKEFETMDQNMNLLARLSALKGSKLNKRKSKVMILTDSDDDRRFYFSSFAKATAKYLELEKELEGRDIVLVRGLSEENIRTAFQNYFSDTKDFVHLVKEGISTLSPPLSKRK